MKASFGLHTKVFLFLCLKIVDSLFSDASSVRKLRSEKSLFPTKGIMDVGTLLSAVQTLFAALQCSELKQLYSIATYKSEIENLGCTVGRIKASLDDAESKKLAFELSDQAQLWIEELKDAVYDADDLVDEFVTLGQRQKLMKGGNVSQKVRNLFSQFNFVGTAHKMSQGVKEIRKRLVAIQSDHNQFGFKFDTQSIRGGGEKTSSIVDAPSIIGRGDDQEKIVGILLDPNIQRSVSCLFIAGMGGLGKTTLAQLVYNDPRIKENFPLRLWTCVSDQDKKSLDVEATLRKILLSVTSINRNEELSMELLHNKIQELLKGKKYLLVLDDLWNANDLQWSKLVTYLTSNVGGAWILVTTRIEETNLIVGGKHIHKLKGLSEEDSWRLFEMMAFGEIYGHQHHTDLVEIGRDIVKKCANVPLAITVVGRLLRGEHRDKWLWFRKAQLGRIKEGDNKGIGPILKFSYYHLDPPLRACFSYCALFPKDHVIDKEMLISLWMAQDYIVSQEGYSVEDVGEKYFSILVNRYFFQDLKKDEFGNIISCKIHDLLHDIALEVSGKEVCTINFKERSLHNKTRHISYSCTGGSSDFQFSKTKIRTCLSIGCTAGMSASVVDMLSNWKCLRALDLSRIGVQSLPSELVTLLHLRYLDLSRNDRLTLLPNSFSKLQNLQTLSLRHCGRLKDLPEDLSELVKLRVLDIEGCSALNSMPKGLGKLTSLHKMSLFVAGDRMSFSKLSFPKRSIVNQMEELKALTNLKGSLYIEICRNAEYAKANVKEGGYIKNKENLNCLRLQFFDPWFDKTVKDEQGLLLEDLRPPCNLRELRLWDYHGMNMPSWAKEDDWVTFLPNLVKLQLLRCSGWQHLPSLRKLPNLKSLQVSRLDDLEYIENTSSKAIINDGVSASDLAASFPSLQELALWHLDKLKGWWRDGDDIIDCDINGQQHLLTSFPSLSELSISTCPNFKCVITCPNVEKVSLSGELNERLRIMIPIESGNSKLRDVRVGSNLGNLKSIVPTKAFQCVHEMIIEFDHETESLSEVEEVFRSCSSLRKLWISNCWKLKSVSGGLEYLTALEFLSLEDLPSLIRSKAGEEEEEEEEEGEGEEEGEKEEEKEEEDDMPWRCLGHNLRELSFSKLPELVNLPKGMCYLTALESLNIEDCEGLESLSNEGEREGEGEENDGLPWRCLGHNLRELWLSRLPKLVNLPKGMRYLRALQDLVIQNCPALESLPESMRELTSLKKLSISHCSDSLKERCRENTGEDWPNIQHIPEKWIW